MKNITGYFIYKDTTTQQHEDIAQPFTELFTKIMPKQIVEIGTSSGGLTLLLRDILDNLNLQTSLIRTYDVHDNNYIKYHVNEDTKIDVIKKNIFNHTYDSLLEEETQDITNFIQQSGPTVVLCDGGSKKNEFNIFSKILKKGDIIMAHDYASTQEYFLSHISNKIWNWHEINDEDIRQACAENNLIPYMDTEFKNVVWVCKQKN
jgi:hypothetical protein